MISRRIVMAKKLEYSLLNVKLIWVYIKSVKKLKKETQQERFVFEKTIHLGKVFRKLYSMYSMKSNATPQNL